MTTDLLALVKKSARFVKRNRRLQPYVNLIAQRLTRNQHQPHAARVRSEPNYLQIEVTGKCNFGCGFCGREQFTKNQHMSFETFCKILDGFEDVKTLNLQGFGEPMMNPDIYRMIGYAKESKGAYVFFYSNGSILNSRTSQRLISAGLDQINISFDGATAETFERLRPGANFARICDGVESLISAKIALNTSIPRITFRANCLKENFEEMPGIVTIARRMQVDEVRIQNLIEVEGTELATKEQLPSSIDRDTFLRVLGVLERMKAEPGAELNIDQALVKIARDAVRDRKDSDNGVTGKQREEFKRYCPWITDRGYIDVSGTFMPCCYAPYFKTATDEVRFEHSIHELTIGQIWNSKEYRILRESIAEGNPLPLCRQCPVLK